MHGLPSLFLPTLDGGGSFIIFFTISSLLLSPSFIHTLSIDILSTLRRLSRSHCTLIVVKVFLLQHSFPQKVRK